MTAGHEETPVSRPRKGLVIAAGALAVAAIVVVGVLQLAPDGPTEPVAATEAPPVQLTAADVANQFLSAFAAGQAADAARLTDDEAAATTQLAEVWRTLSPTAVTTVPATAEVPPPDATVVDEKFTLSWHWGVREWTYDSGLHLVKKEAGWRVNWRPTLVHPKLAAGQSLALRDGNGQPAVVDRDGTPLVNRVGEDTAPADPTLAPRLVGAMGRVAAGQGTAGGWYVALVDAAGKDLEVVYGSPTASLVSTLSVPVQKAAQAAVDSQPLPTMLVAIQPSTGDILAVAQNAAAGSEPTALNGLYPPGSTFKIATATALVEGGVADVGTVVPCPGSTTVGQRTVTNAGFELGDVPLRTAFAKSCNTTFAEQAAKLAPPALGDAADQLGLGADFDIPGITTEAGSVPDPANATEQVEDSIGQGRVQASCFGMALVSATVASGGAVTPKLWRDLPTTVTTPYSAPPARVVGSLRTMMRDVVTAGRAGALARYGPVAGKTGTAEIDGGAAHGWFTGYRDDLAFATLVVNGNTSDTAVAVTGTFLTALG
ncbi:penicillin-binding transpeptidase domain-containing protein [Actinophytocola oryzae]|uniref:MecA-like transpeptidase family protein n=1 Tax=Actinophytocola oryzae TaxID=502181 RepID=A0A4R7VFT9_9PSEU|nr:penicillin-binding transpeptidase domain-containing protein [Actinophytocola oryzae]TDV47919.1 MecA-like transpeptidase family protein [Actinophytocola oryzae]